MKKVTLILSALALVLGLSQCNKEKTPALNGEKQHIVLNASFAESNSKIAEDGFGGLKWSDEDGKEDHIIVKQGETELGELECTDAEDGIFEGDIESATGNITFTFGEEKYLEQTGNLNAAIYLTASAPYDAKGEYNVTMNMPHAVLKLDVSALGTTGAMTIAANGATVASVTDVASSEGKAVFVAVPADGTPKAYTISCGGKTAMKTWALLPNVFYTKADAEGAGTGGAVVITPMFTIDGDGTMVEFAPGNLYWDGSAFHFEENQWSTTRTWNSNHVSHFFWSKDARVGYAANYSEANSQYGITPTTSDVFFTNGTQATANPDFHVNGETAGTWRTLSKAEWDYLLNSRTSASSLRARVTLEDVNVSGFVILPDGSSANASSITTSSAVATSGAVFLPAAGYRLGTEMEDVVSHGYYRSSTPKGAGTAYHMYFYLGNMNANDEYRSYGMVVRLVR